MNASFEGICVEFERKKQHNIGFSTFKFETARKYQTYFMTDPLNIIIWRFRYVINRLLERIQLSLYSTTEWFQK